MFDAWISQYVTIHDCDGKMNRHISTAHTAWCMHTMGHTKAANLFLPVTSSKINGF